MARWQYDKKWPSLTTTAYKSLTGQSSNAHLLFPDSELISERLQSLTELHIMTSFIVMKYNGPVNTRWSPSKISPPSQSSGRDVGDLEAGRRLGRMCISRDTDPPDVLRRVRLPSESLSGAEGWPFCRPE